MLLVIDELLQRGGGIKTTRVDLSRNTNPPQRNKMNHSYSEDATHINKHLVQSAMEEILEEMLNEGKMKLGV